MISSSPNKIRERIKRLSRLREMLAAGSTVQAFSVTSLEFILCMVVLIGSMALHFPEFYSRLGLPIEVCLSLLSFATPISGILWLSAAQVVPDPPIGPISSSQLAMAGFLLWQLRPRHRSQWASSKPLLMAVAPFFIWIVALNFIHGGGIRFPLLLTYSIATGCAAAILVHESNGRLVSCLLAFLAGQLMAASVFWIVKHHLGVPVQAFDVDLYGDATIPGARMGTARGNANTLGPPMALVISGVLGLWVASSRQRPDWKWAVRLVTVLGLAGSIGPLVASGSRGAIIATGCGLLVLALMFILFSSATENSNMAIVSVILLAVGAWAWNHYDLKENWTDMEERQQIEVAEANLSGTAKLIAGRNFEWTAAWRGILDSPITGGGKVEMLSYQDDPEMWASHSTYLDAGLAGGFPGMMLFGLFVLKPLMALWPRRHEDSIIILLVVYVTSAIAIGSTSAMQVKHFWILWGMASTCFLSAAAKVKARRNRATRSLETATAVEHGDSVTN